MGIWDRLETVIKSYLTHEEENIFWKKTSSYNDPDINEAYEELDDFLNGTKKTGEGKSSKREETVKKQKERTVPEELKKDFAELGLTPEASAEECKEAYKKLLKIHHPDRHAKHDENMKKATEKSARVNAAYERLVIYFRIQNQI